ncbi:DNA polymerase epsilon subunit 4-like Protein [Tribolium castaneum]|uniref:DNA polymerase epsilon subunit 4-like Protein n=1 Tax=Tribolium castaneum TaxID=7070 RepID=D7EHU8_TRICA|nr:PREDICTED: DNA polymerase epsilon subunit 4 [Tribolium castaneum]EFA12164.1 DNA polymerase epsilon subunit 4-like Protein [Tribolium castaneum]|eukprot:XP_015840379.1 PREDICTED: DNA polymerase epsilon subunit 4 [Tribolium castaneum]
MEDINEVDIEEIETERQPVTETPELVELTTTSPEKPKLVKLPLARIKHIMKMDPDCNLVSQDALFLVTKSTEMFLEHLAKESGKFMGMGKRKTVQKRDVDAAIDNIPSLCFLDGALE